MYRAMLALVVVCLVGLLVLLVQPPTSPKRPSKPRVVKAAALDAGASTKGVQSVHVAEETPERIDPEVCADCHPEEVAGFAESGMGRSLYTPENAKVVEDFSAEKATVTASTGGYVYRAFIDD